LLINLFHNPWFWIFMHWSGKALLAVIPVVAAFVGVLITNRTNERMSATRFKEDERIQHSHYAEEAAIRERSTKRASGEEIYTLMETWSASVRFAGLEYARKVAEQPAAGIPNSFLDISKPLRTKMLIVVHFPHLEIYWKATMDEFQKLLDPPEPGSTTEAKETRREYVHEVIRQTQTVNLYLMALITKEIKQIPY
jgi:hypothetical protein